MIYDGHDLHTILNVNYIREIIERNIILTGTRNNDYQI